MPLTQFSMLNNIQNTSCLCRIFTALSFIIENLSVGNDFEVHQGVYTFVPWRIINDILSLLKNKWNLFLTFSTLGKNFSRGHTEIFFSYFSQKTGFDISCKLSPMKIIYMKCQVLFSGKNKQNNINLSSAGLTQRVVKVNSCVSEGPVDKSHKDWFLSQNDDYPKTILLRQNTYTKYADPDQTEWFYIVFHPVYVVKQAFNAILTKKSDCLRQLLA